MSYDSTPAVSGPSTVADEPMSALYPFLYAASPTGDPGRPVDRAVDLAVVLAEATRSTQEKAREIIALREVVRERYGEQICACARQLAAAFVAGGRLFAFGNGGSATDAAALASRFLYPGRCRPALPAYVLTGDIASVTALANDIGFEAAFARQLAALARPGDIAVGLSTSGNSPNLLAALTQARRGGLVTLGLAGDSGGAMAELDCLDHLFVVPSGSVHRIQEAQTTVYHVLWEMTLAALPELAGHVPGVGSDRGATQAGREQP